MNLVSFATKTAALAAVMTLTFVTGCANTTAQSTAQGPHKWERRELANGVELNVSEDASPEARRVAEQIQSEMRSRYISAR